MILIVADASDLLAAEVRARLAARGRDVWQIGPEDWNALRFCWELPSEPAEGHVVCGERRVALAELSGALVRTLPSTPLRTVEETDEQYLTMEWSAALNGFLGHLPCRVINRPRPGQRVRQPFLAAWAEALKQAGLLLPEVRMTADTGDLPDFRHRHSAARILAATGESRPLSDAAVPPCCLIEVPDGDRHRIFVAGGQAFAASAPGTRLAARALAAVQRLGLELAALDLVSNENGDWIVDLDESPGLEQCPAPIGDAVIEALATALSVSREAAPA